MHEKGDLFMQSFDEAVIKNAERRKGAFFKKRGAHFFRVVPLFSGWFVGTIHTGCFEIEVQFHNRKIHQIFHCQFAIALQWSSYLQC